MKTRIVSYSQTYTQFLESEKEETGICRNKTGNAKKPFRDVGIVDQLIFSEP